mmetsp:Transcript_13194/g.30844  ORF Transcript_13194/g.30844 Transcript_13194/m.30844 type:complete len:493 (-) Transcript_13194:63-1541(-)
MSSKTGGDDGPGSARDYEYLPVRETSRSVQGAEYHSTSDPARPRHHQTPPLGGRQTSASLETDREARIAAARLAGLLLAEKLQIEAGSVYGAAVVMPQVARSGGWSGTLTALAVWSYLYLFLNIVLQIWTNFMIAQEEKVYDLFAGQMYLCDFAANLQACPDGPGCDGPGGTKFTPARIYNFETWSTRKFVQKALMDLFPDRAEDIQANVDPGEYGLESQWCRLLCCFIFMLSVIQDLLNSLTLAHLLWVVPTERESWLTLKDWQEAAKYGGDSSEVSALYLSRRGKGAEGNWMHSWLDTVQIKVAGMPRHWKVINFICVLVPKLCLWKITVQSGIVMLMETSNIETLIVNSVALTFILSIDEMICAALMSDASHTILERCESYELFDVDEKMKELQSDEMILSSYGGRRSFATSVFPTKLVVVMILTWYFVWDYHTVHCDRGVDGYYVSKSMYRPKSLAFGVLELMFPNWFRVPSEDAPFWEMKGAYATDD